jgi:hypothetical protein
MSLRSVCGGGLLLAGAVGLWMGGRIVADAVVRLLTTSPPVRPEGLLIDPTLALGSAALLAVGASLVCLPGVTASKAARCLAGIAAAAFLCGAALVLKGESDLRSGLAVIAGSDARVRPEEVTGLADATGGSISMGHIAVVVGACALLLATVLVRRRSTPVGTNHLRTAACAASVVAGIVLVAGWLATSSHIRSILGMIADNEQIRASEVVRHLIGSIDGGLVAGLGLGLVGVALALWAGAPQGGRGTAR